jgi:hypothetical protein
VAPLPAAERPSWQAIAGESAVRQINEALSRASPYGRSRGDFSGDPQFMRRNLVQVWT